MQFKEEVEKVLNEVKQMLLEKNASYGNSALEPSRIFSKADTIEQLKIRIDDKLTRIQKGKYLREDDLKDILGYMVLLRIKQNELSYKPRKIEVGISDEELNEVLRKSNCFCQKEELTDDEINQIMSDLQKREAAKGR